MNRKQISWDLSAQPLVHSLVCRWIIARGEQPSTEKKLLQAGANEVVSPAAIGGSRIAHIITRPATMNHLGDKKGVVGEELKRLGVEIGELHLHQKTFLVGKKVRELQELGEGNLSKQSSSLSSSSSSSILTVPGIPNAPYLSAIHLYDL